MTRIRSIDLLRGVLMVLMAIDHVRVYSGMPAGGPDPAIFFTRWITHFCVSGFVFFAGTSAFLYGQKLNDKKRLSLYLLTRGLLLVVLELTLIRFCWTFNLELRQFMLAGVIWMIGCCMVLLAAVIWLPFRAIWLTGLVMIGAQQLFGMVPKGLHWWNFFYPIDYEGVKWISILYVLLPWIGVMMAGYGFGKLLTFERGRRDRLCLRIGLSAIAFFLIAGSVIAITGQHGDQPFVFRLLNQQKYPPSQLFLLMTLGPLIALVPFAEKSKGSAGRILSIFGRVPFFYYILHILLIHLLALLLNSILYGLPHQEWYTRAPYAAVPGDRRWGLPLLYLVFFIVEVMLYYICRAYARYKGSHPGNKWLRYL